MNLDGITHGEISPRVGVLQSALAALGMSVKSRERDLGMAGDDTARQLDRLRDAYELPAGGDALVDGPLGVALERELALRGLNDSAGSFIVAGTVRDRLGVPVVRQRVVAFDLDLRGIRARRKAQSLADLKIERGFEPLGETVTNRSGRYSVTFFEWQYPRADRGTADVVVFAVGVDEQIVGASRLMHTADFDAGRFVDDVNVLLEAGPTDERTEFERTHAIVDPFLVENKVDLAELGAEEVDFTARELGLSAQRIMAAATARLRTTELRLDNQHELAEEMLYGLSRAGVTLELRNLNRSEQELRALIDRAVTDRVVREPAPRALTSFLRLLRASAVDHAIDAPVAGDVTLGEMLAPVLPDADLRRTYVASAAEFADVTPAAFWTEYLPAQKGFKDRPDLVEQLRFAEQLQHQRRPPRACPRAPRPRHEHSGQTLVNDRYRLAADRQADRCTRHRRADRCADQRARGVAQRSCR